RGRLQQRRSAGPGRPPARGAGVRPAGGPRPLAGRGARPAQEVARGGRTHAQAPAAPAAGPQRALRGDAAMSGLVSLVGAGPGDPDLLTRRAAQRLAEADLVLYDALVDPAVLELAGKAQRFYVGKRAGRHHVTQEQIHRILIRAARRGQRVVRLKGGDPFVFGRGGEEALALAEAGIAFEVIPGVSASIA